MQNREPIHSVVGEMSQQLAVQLDQWGEAKRKSWMQMEVMAFAWLFAGSISLLLTSPVFVSPFVQAEEHTREFKEFVK